MSVLKRNYMNITLNIDEETVLAACQRSSSA